MGDRTPGGGGRARETRPGGRCVLVGGERAPTTEREKDAPTKEGGDRVLVDVCEPERIEPGRHCTYEVMRAELEVVAEANGRLRLVVELVGHGREGAGNGKVVCVEREDVRCPGRLQACIPRSPRPPVLVMKEHLDPFGSESLEDLHRFRGRRAVVDDDHVDRLRLLD